jgi:hypothetical protein
MNSVAVIRAESVLLLMSVRFNHFRFQSLIEFPSLVETGFLWGSLSNGAVVVRWHLRNLAEHFP